MSIAETASDLRSALVAVTEVEEGSASCSVDGIIPQYVVYPKSPTEAATVLQLASAHDLVVVAAGGFTQQLTGNTPERVDVLLSTKRLNQVQHYDPGDLTLSVGAGMTIAELQATVAAHQQVLPIDPMLPQNATIGGVLATNAHGPMKSGFGGVRDFCIGIEVVTADGKVVKGGGRVVKNVAGYDLMKLMIGGYGTLGIITSANFKVFPHPRQTRTFVARFSSASEAISYRDRIISSPVGNTLLCMEIASPRAQEYLTEGQQVRDPDEHHPAAPIHFSTEWKLFLRASGSDAVLARYRRELGGAITSELDGVEETAHWARLCDFEATVARRHRNAMVMYVNSPLSSVGSMLESAEQTAVEHNLLCASIGRISRGALVIAFMPLAVDPPSAMMFAAAASAFRGRLPREASAMVARCPRESKEHFDLWGTTPTNIDMMRAVRNALDPRRILNRGRFIV